MILIMHQWKYDRQKAAFNHLNSHNKIHFLHCFYKMPHEMNYKRSNKIYKAFIHYTSKSHENGKPVP